MLPPKALQTAIAHAPIFMTTVMKAPQHDTEIREKQYLHELTVQGIAYSF